LSLIHHLFSQIIHRIDLGSEFKAEGNICQWIKDRFWTFQMKMLIWKNGRKSAFWGTSVLKIVAV
jgi:hypothetical protein